MNLEVFENVKNVKVLVFGDFMVDEYVNGKVNRISPEAPVPVLEITSRNKKLGGAGNVVKNIISVGASVKIAGVIGNDLYGKWMKEEFTSLDIDTNYLYLEDDYNTIVKTRIVSKSQQFIRCDDEIVKNIDPDRLTKFKHNVNNIFENINILIISDYAKGSVSHDIAQLLINEAKSRNIKIIVDPKGKDYIKYIGATLCTPNLKELSDVSDIKIENEEDIINASKNLINKVNLEHLLVTRSEDGMSLISNQMEKFDIEALAKEVSDVTGAGDTVISILSVMLALGMSLEKSCEIANVAASIVVTKFGAATVSLNELISAMVNSNRFKFIPLNTAKYIVDDLKERNRKVVFTNGCFDLLHAGHLSSFQNARKYGDILIVAVNSDASVKKIKGDLRPIIDEENRIKMLCALEYIDYVVLMDDDNPSNIIQMIKPDIAIKGEDWKDKIVPEKEIVESYGGKMEFVPLDQGLSTTNIIKKIIEAYNE